ncbi:uncharacterized protein LOC111042224 [Myzus persicae]|uniref:uncharacterized protein LOC111042224 n=1 Tax=Myzus persicae TaxID=13164 RepID=UPI000B933610|nr:uncharacterized protein LOC111042224 [Myzus persicae]
MLNKNLVFTINGNVKDACWKDMIDLFELDSNIQEVIMLPRLTRQHVIPTEINKIKVKLACQVLSQRVAAILYFLASKNIENQRSHDTTTLCWFFAKLFDSVNCNFHKVVDGKIYCNSVKNNSPHHQLWRESIQVSESMYFINPVTKEKSIQPPTVKNWIRTLKGFQDVVKIMNDNGVNSLLL